MNGFKQVAARASHRFTDLFRDEYGHRSPKRITAGCLVGVVVLGGIGAGIVAATSSSAPPRAAGTTTTTTSTTTAPHKHRRPPTKPVTATCPLTGLPAPGGKVPQRPVLAVKVGNNPTARPQSGLEDADIVYDTLAEGGITRYIAVFQCNEATSVGPIRSVRWDDWHILQEYGHADLSFVHGIDPDVDAVEQLPWICDLDAFAHFNLYEQDPERVAPDATYSSTSALWGACPSEPAPPAPFSFSTKVPSPSKPVAQVEIPYSSAADVVWQWSASHGAFMHNYRQDGAIVPDDDNSGNQLQAKNVVIVVVQLQYGATPETPGATGDVESITEGSGTAYVLRNGREIKGTWVRPTWADLMKFKAANGSTIDLQPGNTWVEIVPNTDTIAFTG